MKPRIVLLALAFVAVPLCHAGPRRGAAVGSPAVAHAGAPWRADAQDAVRHEEASGAVHSLKEIERRVVPGMPGMEYLGPEYDPAAMAYRLKFIHDGHVVFVDVDARSGEVIRQSR